MLVIKSHRPNNPVGGLETDCILHAYINITTPRCKYFICISPISILYIARIIKMPPIASNFTRHYTGGLRFNYLQAYLHPRCMRMIHCWRD